MTIDPDTLWQNGLPLRAAANCYASPETHERWEKWRKLVADPNAVLRANKQDPETTPPFFKLLTWGTVAATSALSSSPIQDEARAGLWTGDLVAAGYAMPRRHEDKPVLIPADVWGARSIGKSHRFPATASPMPQSASCPRARP